MLKQFGAAFSRMSEELLAAWRDRTVECLLLEDLEEIARYQCAANGAPAEIRIFKSNLAVLPLAGVPVQWRLAEIDSCVFEAADYRIVLQSAGERLVLSKLGKKTDEAFANLRQSIDALHTRCANALHELFPFLNADALRRLQQAMPEGRSCPIPTLAAIHTKLPDALKARAVDESLTPYFESLNQRSTAPLLAGFKFTWGSGEDEEEGGEPAAAEIGGATFLLVLLPAGAQCGRVGSHHGNGPRYILLSRGGSGRRGRRPAHARTRPGEFPSGADIPSGCLAGAGAPLPALCDWGPQTR